ncbi:MAG TPA: alkaline phosphatase family protein, partial [Acidimicrobiales bacterium]|nr:alkaline phosphatase family protein [Acidimicrobiales bacterium]
VDHNPTVYYTSVDKQCDQWDQPLGTAKSGALHQALTTGPAASLTTVTPDVQDNMHSGTVAQADKWLAKWVPQILDSPAYRAGHLAVLIVWDEGSGSGDNTSHVPLIVMSASTPAGTRSPLRFNDFSVLQAMCELSGVAPLGEAVSAPSLLAPFHL